MNADKKAQGTRREALAQAHQRFRLIKQAVGRPRPLSLVSPSRRCSANGCCPTATRSPN
jgi:hypothetical protein